MCAAVQREFGLENSQFLGETDALGDWLLNRETTLNVLGAVCARPEAVIVIGTAFSFLHLLDYLAERKAHLELPAGSRVMETGGYKGRSRMVPKPQLHAQLSASLGVSPTHIVSEYGMSEISSQGYDAAIPQPQQITATGPRVFRFPPWARVQVISPETEREVKPGQTGLIRIFDLANAYSVMAVQTEDLGIRHDYGFELIGRAALVEPRGCSLMAVDGR
jgi:hypothetical protein